MGKIGVESERGSKRPINTEAAEQLVMEITQSIAQPARRSPQTPRRRQPESAGA